MHHADLTAKCKQKPFLLMQDVLLPLIVNELVIYIKQSMQSYPIFIGGSLRFIKVSKLLEET